MTTQEVAEKLCKDIVRRVAEWDGRAFIVTNFHYPGGETVNLYLDTDRMTMFADENDVILSDLGNTLYKCRESGVEISAARTDFIENVCNAYDVNFTDGVLWKQMPAGAAGSLALSLCEAITRISSLEYDASSRSRSSLREQVVTLLAARLPKSRTIKTQWFDEATDVTLDHPIDIRINGDGEPRNIFTVNNDEGCDRVAAVSHFFQLKGIWVKSVAIVEPRAHLGKMYRGRLQNATGTVLTGLADHAEQIIRFALAETKESN